jgi:enoyl-CoA hydratase
MTSSKKPFVNRTRDWYAEALDYKNIIYAPNEQTHVARITLNRPEVMNALNHELRGELFHALKVAERNNNINVIVIKGAGRCFSAGYDLGPGMGPAEPDLGSQYGDTDGPTHWARYVIQQWWQLWELSKVIIAQVHGYALAGASEFAAMCDLMVVTPDCQIGYPPLRSMGVDMLWFPWLLPMRKAHELAFTGDNITGEDAYRYGMANYCVPDSIIDEFTDVFAQHVALMPWQMATQYKRALKKAYELQGFRIAVETSALFAYHRAMDTDYARKMDDLIRKVPLKQYLNTRDDPYRETLDKMKKLLEKGKQSSK